MHARTDRLADLRLASCIILGTVLTLCAIAWIGLLALSHMFGVHPHPSDHALIKNFHAHKAEFNTFRMMFIADLEASRVAPDWSDVPLDQARWDRYRDLFQTLGLESGVQGYDKAHVIWFHASSSGLSVSGSSKGYVYSETPPAPLVPDLDTTDTEDGETIYRHIEGHWYLYYEWT